MIAEDLCLTDMSIGKFLTEKIALYLRTSDDDELHGSGRRIDNRSEGMTIAITKDEEAAGSLHAYVYVIMDAQLHIENSRFESVLY